MANGSGAVRLLPPDRRAVAQDALIALLLCLLICALLLVTTDTTPQFIYQAF